MTYDEHEVLRKAIDEALDRGDDETYYVLVKKLPMSPRLALASKESFGAQWLIEQGFNLSLANERYGKDWLHA